MTANTSAGPKQSIAFAYDWQGRRIHKQVWPNTNGSGSPTNDEAFAYDGWNLLGILNSSLALQTSCAWGSDLSGTMQNAGGAGGLLFISNWQSPIGYDAVAYDGNGNAAGLVDVSSESPAAQYAYGPFGEVIRATGPIAKANPFRFSTKFQDDETDVVYYGYRYYTQSTGRWLGRDPIEERGGKNLFAFVGNNPITRWDATGHMGCRGEVIVGHYRSFLKPDASSRQIRDDIVYVGCGANRLNWMWSLISGYPVNDFPPPSGSDGYPDQWGDTPNTNAPAHMPGYPELSDEDYSFSEELSPHVEQAIKAIRTSVCSREGCCLIRVQIRCQTEAFEGEPLSPYCGRTLTIACPSLLNAIEAVLLSIR